MRVNVVGILETAIRLGLTFKALEIYKIIFYLSIIFFLIQHFNEKNLTEHTFSDMMKKEKRKDRKIWEKEKCQKEQSERK